jgi:hypothetical protein
LRNERRRYAIKQLRMHLEPVSVRELSERVAEEESGESPAPRNLRESVYNSLHQTHLPKLDERDVIEYDRDRKMVELLVDANQVNAYMEVASGYGVTWATLYRTLGVGSLLAIVAVNANAPLLSAVPTLVVAVVCLVAFGLATTYELWSSRYFYLKSLRDSW